MHKVRGNSLIDVDALSGANSVCVLGLRLSRLHRPNPVVIQQKLTLKPKHISLPEWVNLNQNKHLCQCGCNQPIIIKSFHRVKGIPRFRPEHKHKTALNQWQTLKNEGYYTIKQVCHNLGIGQTTLRRHEGKLFPYPKKTEKGMRLYTECDAKKIKEVLRQNR